MQFRFLTLATLVSAAAAQSTPTLTALLQNTSSLSNLTNFVSLFPTLLNSLANATNITILAPSNNAFTKLLSSPQGMALANDTSLIEALLMYHVLDGTYYADAVTSTPAFIPTMLTNTSYTNVTGGQVVEAVTSGSNVVFYSGLLQNSTVTTANVNFTGGVVHIIDTLLTLPVNVSTTAIAANLTAAAGALTTAGLVDVVDTLTDITIFVPDNDAFAAIGSAIPNLTMAQLTQILEYHVINGTVGYSSLLSNTTLTTVEGGSLTITIENGDVFVNSAKVITPNVLVANGVVHVIDNVLNPNNTSASPNVTASTQVPAFSGASSASSVPFTSGIPTPTMSASMSAASGASASATGSAAMSSAYAMPMKTGAVGAVALFGAAGAAMLNF